MKERTPPHNKRREELSFGAGAAEGRKSSGKKKKNTPSDTAHTAASLSLAQKRGVQKQHDGKFKNLPHIKYRDKNRKRGGGDHVERRDK
eukprot:15365486-Ditylum_brightwellii.AAC.1